MTGWEAGVLGSIGDYTSITDNQWAALLDLAVTELGINRVRLDISSGAEGPGNGSGYNIVNDNADPNVINPAGFNFTTVDWRIDHIIQPWRQRVIARGETPYINLEYVDFGASAFEHNQNPQEYAEFMLATFQHLNSKYGFVPNGIEVMHAPNDVSGWSPDKLGAVIVATAARLQAAGFAVPDFIGPSTSNMGAAPSFIDGILAVPGAAPLIKEFSYHRYGGTLSDLQQIAARAVQHGKRTSMLEYWGDFFTPNSGANYEMLNQDLTEGRNSAWQQGVFADAYGCINQWTRLTNGVAELCPNAKLNRQYTKYVRPGAQRIEATGNANFSPVAFVNANGAYVVVVKSDTGGSFSVSGLPAGVYGIFSTERGGTVQQTTNWSNVTLIAGQTLSTNIPSAGVITIYRK